MATSSPKLPTASTLLSRFLNQQTALHWEEIDFYQPDQVATLHWKGYTGNRGEILSLLRGYQRLHKLLLPPDPPVIFALLDMGIFSALQLANIPQARLEDQLLSAFQGNVRVLHDAYYRALEIRSRVLLDFINSRQLHETTARPLH